ncbi:ABC transporter substrate-binding protein [Acetivibrio mesophilus]|uniref:ABC transporter substrate-binding protein n=1 Tax=Acetivibrio mesophilus TaxID=2487273 RepID=A0A4Q0I328_9FIRM|nr:ABC transporter substrate-binding protein [Acetivibrio mesophilus]ODM27708.1 metal ABC transporter substrate-binding protein [Clostridium sp. Bc-iso-3]RXE58650.1 ABC transporter substrate-binding protein [Acetivibrio mesophilus]HHV30135.1 ABC transporter substrate-binding protein [Clostridium sp.]
MRKKAVIFTLLVLMILNLAGCSNENRATRTGENVSNDNTQVKTIKIAYLPITHALPLYVENELAEENFKNFKLELVKFGSWTELVDALNSGKVDGASMLIELAMKAKEQGIDLKAVALGHRDGNVVVVSKDINKVEDLKGKNFAIPSKLSTHNILLHIMLEKGGLTYSDVNVIELPPPEMSAALAEGRISGYCVAEPFGAKSVAVDKGKTLFESQDLWEGSVCCGLVLRNDFIENNEAIAEEFIKEYINAGHKAELKDNVVRDIATKYLKAESEVLDLSLKWISYENLKLEEKDYNELSKYMVEMGLSKNPPEYSEFVDNTFIGKVK